MSTEEDTKQLGRRDKTGLASSIVENSEFREANQSAPKVIDRICVYAVYLGVEMMVAKHHGCIQVYSRRLKLLSSRFYHLSQGYLSVSSVSN